MLLVVPFGGPIKGFRKDRRTKRAEVLSGTGFSFCPAQGSKKGSAFVYPLTSQKLERFWLITRPGAFMFFLIAEESPSRAARRGIVWVQGTCIVFGVARRVSLGDFGERPAREARRGMIRGSLVGV